MLCILDLEFDEIEVSDLYKKTFRLHR
ncbi:hypothetical protein ACPFTT_003019 [Vibrio cholerae]